MIILSEKKKDYKTKKKKMHSFISFLEERKSLKKLTKNVDFGLLGFQVT